MELVVSHIIGDMVLHSCLIGVAKTRVRVTPRMRVSFKGRVKAYGNITVSMIMQRSFIPYSYWFC